MAVYDRSSKTVTCSACIPRERSGEVGVGAEPARQDSQLSEAMVPEPEEPEVFAGIAGASARLEGKRRSEKREARILKKYPVMGKVILALSEDPQSTKAWEVGARGEEKLGRRLDGLKSDTVHVLHDRGIPGSKANIDHMVVCPSGVFVIDAKKYKGRPNLRVEGGFLRERTETFMVGSRNCTKLVLGAQRQVNLVLAALAKSELQNIPVIGILCFVEAEWPLLGGDFTTSGIKVLGPKKAVELIRKAGPINAVAAQHVFRTLATLFPAA